MTARTDEQGATRNEAALRFRLRAEGVADLPDQAALRRFAAADPAAFEAAILAFAGVAGPPAALAALLLEADLRPDDRLLVAGVPALAWLGALARVVVVADAVPETLRAVALARQASVVLAPRSWLAAAGIPVAGPADAAASGLRGVHPQGWPDCNRDPSEPFPDHVQT